MVIPNSQWIWFKKLYNKFEYIKCENLIIFFWFPNKFHNGHHSTVDTTLHCNTLSSRQLNKDRSLGFFLLFPFIQIEITTRRNKKVYFLNKGTVKGEKISSTHSQNYLSHLQFLPLHSLLQYFFIKAGWHVRGNILTTNKWFLFNLILRLILIEIYP